jgi:hypothetical protein
MVFDSFKDLSPALQGKYWKECVARQSYSFPNHGVEPESRMTASLSASDLGSSRHLGTNRMAKARSGYTGYIPSKQCENIHGKTYQEVKSTAESCVRKRASGDQRQHVISGHVPKSPAHRSASEPTLSTAVGFESSSPSIFGNPRGNNFTRPGASVPGYAGYIPGKTAGAVFGKRFFEANTQATQVRHGKYGGAPVGSNWTTSSENDRREMTIGAGLNGEGWRSRTLTSLSSSQALPSGGAWAPYQPMGTHEWMRDRRPQTHGVPPP